MQSVFIHGLGQNPDSWDKTISFLSAPDPTFRPDLTAILRPKEVIYPNLYSSFVNYCNDIPGTLNLCGLSLGAILALNYALDYPGKVNSIVLIGAQYRMPKGLLKFQNIIFRLTPEKFFLKSGFQKQDLIKLAVSMYGLDFSNQLKNITCPALILCGEKDRANFQAARRLSGMLPNANCHFIRNAGHEVNIDAPSELAAALNGFQFCGNR